MVTKFLNHQDEEVKTNQEEMEPPGHKVYWFDLAVGEIASQSSVSGNDRQIIGNLIPFGTFPGPTLPGSGDVS